MRKWIYYNIHGLVRVKTDINLNLPEYFITRKEEGNPDLIVQTIPRIRTDDERLYRIGRRYYGVKHGKFVYDVLPFFGGRIGTSLREVRGKTTILGVTPLYSKLVRMNVGFYLLPISVHFQALLDLSLIKKGYTMVHASALVVSKNHGVVFTGIGGAGKSLAAALSLSICNEAGYLADDVVITDGKKAYCFPSFAGRTGFIDKLLCGLSQFLISTPKYKFSSFRVVKSADVKKIYFLEGGARKITKLAKKEAIEKMLITKACGIGSYLNNSLFMAYQYFNPQENIEEFKSRERGIIQRIIEQADVFELSFNSPEELADLLKEIL
jgi:hypothetical protein